MKNSPSHSKKFICIGLVIQFVLQSIAVLAWDAGTESRRHIEGSGGENPITILDTRPFWAQSTALTNSGRVADCPDGYTNTGATCYRGPSTIGNASILGNCPAGYTNTGLSCFSGADTYSAPSILASCPSGYTNMGLYCQKSPPFGATTSTMVCPSGYFIGAAKRCFKTCREGYTNNGETCGKGASTIGIGSMTCPAGYTKGTAGRCYKPCPTGYTSNGETCGRGADSIGISRMTCRPGEVKLETSVTKIPRCYNPPVCPSGFEYFGFLCYISRPGAVRTAVSTVKMEVKQGGNTHLWIVNRAIELLAKSDDPGAREFARQMNLSDVRTAWENGLWDGDGTEHVDFPNNMGTHFYNGALKDWRGNPTKVVTYDIVEGSILPIVGGIVGGVVAPVGPGGVVVGAALGASAQKIIFKNKKTCSNARECAKEQITTINGSLNKSNAYALGLALHYMTDATQPMHTSSYDGLKIPNNLHPQWEYYAPFVQDRFQVTNMTWDKRWVAMDHDNAFHNAALKSNSFAPRLSNALHISGDAGVTTIQSFNGIGPYTGYNIYNDPTIDALTGEILRDAYQSTASYLYGVYKKANASR